MQSAPPVSRRPGRGGAGLPPFASYVVAIAIAAVARRPGRANPRLPGGAPDAPGGDIRTAAPDPEAASAEPGRGRGATSPTEIPARGWWDIARRAFDEIGNDRILAVAAGVTFYGLLALFPAIGAFVSLYGLVADPATIGSHLSALSGFLPDGALQIVNEQVGRITSKGDTALGFAFFSGLAISLWSANAGVKAVFDALNVAYEEEEKRNFIWLNLWSLAFTGGTVLFLVLALSAVVVIPVVLKLVGLGELTEWIIWAGRWPVLLLLTLGALALLYRYGPSRDRAQWRWLTPGAIFAAVGWIAVSMLFSWYVGSFGSYNETYGSLGAVIGFMTWLWLSSTVILVGAELNAEAEHQTAKDSTEGPPTVRGARGARMADSVGQAR